MKGSWMFVPVLGHGAGRPDPVGGTGQAGSLNSSSGKSINHRSIEHLSRAVGCRARSIVWTPTVVDIVGPRAALTMTTFSLVAEVTTN